MRKLLISTMFILALFSCQKEPLEPTCDQFKQCTVTWMYADKIYEENGLIVAINRKKQDTTLNIPICDEDMSAEDFLRKDFEDATNAERNFHERWNEMVFGTDENGNTTIISFGTLRFEC